MTELRELSTWLVMFKRYTLSQLIFIRETAVGVYRSGVYCSDVDWSGVYRFDVDVKTTVT